jgi:DNA-binding NarL/FixJ family response regulator
VLRWATDLAVVGEARDAEEACALVPTLNPDVVLVGLGDGGPPVWDLVRVLADAGTRVVLIGEPEPDEDLVDALRAGVRGYVRTTVTPQRLLDGVRAVAAGQTVLDSSVTGQLLHHLDDAGDGVAPGATGPLTVRQQAVAELVAEGLTNAEIAARLQLSRATVKGHITVALRRLGLRDRTQLAIHVHRTGRPGSPGGPRDA